MRRTTLTSSGASRCRSSSMARSESWMTANWRPVTMLTFAFVVLHNFVLAPVFSLPSVMIPPDMWELLRIGVGGYIMGRSGEKVLPEIAKILKK